MATADPKAVRLPRPLSYHRPVSQESAPRSARLSQRKRPRRGARRGRFGIVPAGAKARLNKSADRALFRPRRLTVQPAEN
jgi:hypothetical protein